jgi:hypothetical protein
MSDTDIANTRRARIEQTMLAREKSALLDAIREIDRRLAELDVFLRVADDLRNKRKEPTE